MARDWSRTFIEKETEVSMDEFRKDSVPYGSFHRGVKIAIDQTVQKAGVQAQNVFGKDPEWARQLDNLDNPIETSGHEIPAGPGWGTVVVRDHRLPPTVQEIKQSLDRVHGKMAAAPERAEEAASLFAGLLTQPEFIEMTVCACGLIAETAPSGSVCKPVVMQVSRKSKYLRVKGMEETAFVSRKNQEKAAETWNQSHPDEQYEGDDMMACLVYKGGLGKESDTYK